MLAIFLQSGLFFWFIYSMYAVFIDSTLDKNLKILGEITNILALGYIASNITGQNYGVLYFIIGIVLLAWYLYYTPKDMSNSGYTNIQRFVYVTIDVTMLIYLISSLTLALYGTTIINKYIFNVSNNNLHQYGLSWF